MGEPDTGLCRVGSAGLFRWAAIAAELVIADLGIRRAPAYLVEIGEIEPRQRVLEPAPPPGFASVITERF